MSKPIGTYDMPDSPITKGVLDITKGKMKRPERVVIYGPEGVGKSTLASQLPKPLFIDVEGSTISLDVDRIEPQTYQEVLDILNTLLEDPRGYKTIVIDTIDWLEQKMIEKICQENKMESIEDFGYHKGYTYLAEEVFRFVNNLNAFVEAGLNVVLISHAVAKKHELPDQRGQYDRYTLDLVKEVAPIVKEWATMLLFINWRIKLLDDIDDKKGTKSKKKAVGDNVGIIHTTHTATHDAKNRHELPAELALSYASIAHIFDGVQSSVATADPRAELIQRILSAEDFLQTNRVKGFTTTKGKSAARFNYGNHTELEEMNSDELNKVIDHYNELVHQMEGVTK
jgi:hypothetical protein